jgi:hypothetical protein
MGVEKNVYAITNRLVFLNIDETPQRLQTMEKGNNYLVDRMRLRRARRAHDNEAHPPPSGESQRQRVDHNFAPASLGRNGRSTCRSFIVISSTN